MGAAQKSFAPEGFADELRECRTMHGEYKVPGGKLVAADVEVVDGKLATVAISGDFFLEPDEALEQITPILTGLPADTNAAALTHAVEAVIGPDVEMVGFTPESVAIAVRRGVGGATPWREQHFVLGESG